MICSANIDEILIQTGIGVELMYYKNHPIKWIRITGVIVAVDDFSTRRIYTVDDSSGVCIECTAPAPPPSSVPLEPPRNFLTGQRILPPSGPVTKNVPKDKDEPPSAHKPSLPADLDVGTVVKLKGKPSIFRNMKQIAIIKAEVIHGTEIEVRCWNEVMIWRNGVLGQLWEVSEEQEDRCRRRAIRNRKGESDEGRRRRKEAERLKRNGDRLKVKPELSHETFRRRRGEDESEISKEKIQEDEKEKQMQYPSLIARRLLKGKYDALGI